MEATRLFISWQKATLLFLTVICFLGVTEPSEDNTRVCVFYDPQRCIDEPSTCNTTDEVCRPPKKGNRQYCYSVRQIPDGQVVLQGCWEADSHDPDCFNKKHCVSDIITHGVAFCCCEGDYCNRNSSHQPAPTTTNPPSVISPFNGERQSLLLTLLLALLPLMGIAALVVFGYWMYKRHQAAARRHEPLPQHEPSAPIFSSAPLCPVTLLEIKARGRFGCVWRGQLADGRGDVAVKVFPVQDQASFIAERDFYHLPQVSTHANILHYLAAEARGNHLSQEFWLISEFHSHGSLYDYLKRHVISWPQLMHLAVSMAKGLAFLHEDLPANKIAAHKPAVAHRDFKSKNVLVTNDLSVCIADFGLALQFEPGKSVGDTHGQVGTRRYMAPEVLEGAINFNRDAFLRIDMYACGLVLWELMARCKAIDGPVEEHRLPFEEEVGAHPTLDEMQEAVVQNKIRPHIKDTWYKHPGLNGLRDTIEECWDHDPEARLSGGCVEERLSQLMLLTTPATVVVDVLANH